MPTLVLSTSRSVSVRRPLVELAFALYDPCEPFGSAPGHGRSTRLAELQHFASPRAPTLFSLRYVHVCMLHMRLVNNDTPGTIRGCCGPPGPDSSTAAPFLPANPHDGGVVMLSSFGNAALLAPGAPGHLGGGDAGAARGADAAPAWNAFSPAFRITKACPISAGSPLMSNGVGTLGSSHSYTALAELDGGKPIARTSACDSATSGAAASMAAAMELTKSSRLCEKSPGDHPAGTEKATSRLDSTIAASDHRREGQAEKN